jgi:hypothetical protein
MAERRDVVDLLRRANPVSATAARELPLEPIGSLPTGPAAEPPRHKRVGRLRLVLAVALPALVTVIVAPAFGVGRGVLPFLSGERAPTPVTTDFASLSTGAPPGMDPGVIAAETRKVGVWRFEGKSHTLWVAPTRAGGFCFEWTQAVGGCDREGTVPLSPTGAMATMRLPGGGEREAVLKAHADGIPIWVAGHVSAKYADSVEIRFEDGSVSRPAITWVSAPINAGFFAYDIPADRRVIGHRAVSVAALDSHGNRVTEVPLGVGDVRPEPLADAIMSERRAERILETRHGMATIYTAPTRYDGRCLFLSFEGKDVSLYPCLPKGYGFDNLAALRFIPTPDDVIVAGPASAQLHSVEVRFADGDSTVLEPAHSFFLYELPNGHLTKNARATAWLGRDKDGKTILTIPFAKLADPCLGPLPLPPGKHCTDGF